MAEGKHKRALWASPRLHALSAAAGLVVGSALLSASCPRWPVALQPACYELAADLKALGLGQLGGASRASSAATDGGT